MTTKQLLSNFYNAEITSHSRLIIGIAGILFTLSSIALNQKISPFSNVQYLIWCSATFVTSFTFWYVLMRQMYYGVLINSLLTCDNQINNYEEAYSEIAKRAMNLKIKIFFGIFPFQFFGSISRENYRRTRVVGFLICFIFGLGSTILLILLLRLATIADFFEWVGPALNNIL